MTLDRNIAIDILRGIAIIIVAIQHVFIKTLPGNFWQYINFNVGSSFNMALFITVGGYLAYYSLSKHADHTKWLKSKAYYLLVPHFAINILVYPMSMTGIAEWNDLSQTYSFPSWLLNSTFFGVGEWYLYVMFFTFASLVAVNYFKSRIKPSYYIPVMLGVMILVACFPFRLGDVLWINRVQFYIPFAMGGYLIAQYKDAIVSYFSLRRFAIFSLIMVGFYTYFLYLAGWNGGWGSVPFMNLFTDFNVTALRFGQGITMLAPLVLVAYAISKIKYFASGMAWLGKITLGLYMCNLLFTKVGVGSGWTLVWTSVAGTLLIGIVITLLSKKYIFSRVNKYFVGEKLLAINK